MPTINSTRLRNRFNPAKEEPAARRRLTTDYDAITPHITRDAGVIVN